MSLPSAPSSLPPATFLLILAIFSFVFQSLVVQHVQTGAGRGGESFYKPWFLLYIAHGSYVLFLPAIYLFYLLNNIFIKQLPHVEDATGEREAFLPPSLRDTQEVSSTDRRTLDHSVVDENLLDDGSKKKKSDGGIPRLHSILDKAREALADRPSWPQLWVRVSALTFVFTSASLCWYVSVSTIPLGEITAIYNTSCFFTYILSILLLGEPFRWGKFGAVGCSVLGIMVIALFGAGSGEESSPANNHVGKNNAGVGYTSALISSLCAASYEVLYTKFLVPPPPSPSALPTTTTPSLVFSLYITGMIGVVTATFGLLLFPIFHFTRLEVFTLPPWTWEAWGSLALLAVLGMTFNSLFLLAITTTGPVIAALGILVAIPLTTLADWLISNIPSPSDHGRIPATIGWNMVVGSAFIFAGFYLLQVQTSAEKVERKRQQQLLSQNEERGVFDDDEEV